MGAPTTGTTGLGSPQDDLQNHTRILRQLKETTEVAQRQRGDTNNSFVKLGELLGTLAFKYTNNQLSFSGSKTGASGAITTADSIQGAGTVASPLELVGDSASPGNSMYYGTNGAGTKGWFAISGGGGSLTVTDGTTSVAGTTHLQFSGAAVSGTTPNAVVTIGANGGIPSTVANLIYWFQADPISSSFLPYLPNSNPGLELYSPSESGSGATGAAGTLNSLNVVSFPGTSSSQYTFPGSGFILHNCTIFVVNKPTIVGGVGQCYCSGASGSLEFDIDTSAQLQIVKSLIAIIGTSTTTLTTGVWFQGNVKYNDTTGAFAFRVARAAAGSGTNAQTITSNNTNIGVVSGFSFNLNGLIAEIIIYNRDLSSTEITTVENYLFAKWGV